MKCRVAVTGVGVLSALGCSVEEVSKALRDGRSGFVEIDDLDEDEFIVRRAAFITTEASRLVESVEAEESAERYGICCAREALVDAALTKNDLDPYGTGVVIASSNAGVETNICFAEKKAAGSLLAGSMVARTPAQTVASVRMDLGLKGPQAAVSTACAAGSNAVGMAAQMIESGEANIMIAGGVDPFSMLSFSGFTSLKSLDVGPVRSLDESRNGTGLGEGACIFVLESLEQALERGAQVYGEILGYGLSDDAYHATAPDLTGSGAALAIRRCLKNSGLVPDDIDYVNVHGTGTKYNDIMELRALDAVLGNVNIPVSSTKPLHGHTLSCAGSLELLVCLIAIVNGFIPGTFGIEQPIGGFNHFSFPATSQAMRVDVALSTSFGFGGNNACIAVGRV
jgi:3-oxoacyl-[acyl-carrier-protein] synthase